jgi:hypothetical protein
MSGQARGLITNKQALVIQNREEYWRARSDTPIDELLEVASELEALVEKGATDLSEYDVQRIRNAHRELEYFRELTGQI